MLWSVIYSNFYLPLWCCKSPTATCSKRHQQDNSDATAGAAVVSFCLNNWLLVKDFIQFMMAKRTLECLLFFSFLQKHEGDKLGGGEGRDTEIIGCKIYVLKSKYHS